MLVRAPDEVAVDHICMVRTLAHDASRGVEVLGPVMLGDGVVEDHRVHVAAADEETELRLSQDRDRGRVVPVRLGDDADAVTMFLENAGDDGRGERWMVYIGIADNKDEVALVPATRFHVCLRDRHELVAGRLRRHRRDWSSVLRVMLCLLCALCLLLRCMLHMKCLRSMLVLRLWLACALCMRMAVLMGRRPLLLFGSLPAGRLRSVFLHGSHAPWI